MANLLDNFTTLLARALDTVLEKGKPAAAIGTIKTYTNGAQYKKVHDGWEYIGMANKKNKTKNEEKHKEAKGHGVEHEGTTVHEGQVFHHHFLGQVKITAITEEGGKQVIHFKTKDGETESQKLGGFMKSVVLQKKVYKTKKDADGATGAKAPESPASGPKEAEKEPSAEKPAPAEEPKAEKTPEPEEEAVPHGAVLEAEKAYGEAKDLMELMNISGKLASKHKNATPEVKAQINALYKPAFEKLYAEEKAAKAKAYEEKTAAEAKAKEEAAAAQAAKDEETAKAAKAEAVKTAVGKLVESMENAQTVEEVDAALNEAGKLDGLSMAQGHALGKLALETKASLYAKADEENAKTAAKNAQIVADLKAQGDKATDTWGLSEVWNGAGMDAYNALPPDQQDELDNYFVGLTEKFDAQAKEKENKAKAQESLKAEIKDLLAAATSSENLIYQFGNMDAEFAKLDAGDAFKLKQEFGNKINELLEKENAEASAKPFDADPASDGYTAQFKTGMTLPNGETLGSLFVGGEGIQGMKVPKNISAEGTKKKYHLSAKAGGSAVDGEVVHAPNAPYEFFVHKDPNGQGWNVSESQSGVGVVHHYKTKTAAKERIKTIFTKATESQKLSAMIVKVQELIHTHGTGIPDPVTTGKAPKATDPDAPKKPKAPKAPKETHHTFVTAGGDEVTGEIMKHQPGTNAKLVMHKETYGYASYYSVIDAHTGAKLVEMQNSPNKALNSLKKYGENYFAYTPGDKDSFDKWSEMKASNQHDYSTKKGQPFGAASMGPQGEESTKKGSTNNPKIVAVAKQHGISNVGEAHKAYHAIVNHAEHPAAFESALHTAVTNPGSTHGTKHARPHGIKPPQIATNLNAHPDKNGGGISEFFKKVMAKGLAKLGSSKHLHD